MRIFLIGFMGSGKTTIGKRLASPIGFNFVDTDYDIEQQYGQKINQIFETMGEVAFREMERNTLTKLLSQDYLIISTGGGMPCYKDNLDMMLSNGKVIYLKTSPLALAARLSHSRTDRPLIKDKSHEELLDYINEKLAEREPFYKRAHIIIDTEHFSFEELLHTLNLMK